MLEGTTSLASRHVLVIEDDEAIARFVASAIVDLGLSVAVARTGHQGLEMAAQRPPNLVVLDLGLPGLYGTTLGITLRASQPGLPIIVMSALPRHAVAADAWMIGAHTYLTKPFDVDALETAVRSALAMTGFTAS